MFKSFSIAIFNWTTLYLKHVLKVPFCKTHFKNEITNFSRTQGSTVSRPEDDETHASTLSKSDVVLSFQLEVIDDEGVEKIELVLDDPNQPTFLSRSLC